MLNKFDDFFRNSGFSLPDYIEGFLFKDSLWSLTTEYTDCRDVLTPDAGSRKDLVSHCRHYAMTLEIRKAKKRTVNNRKLTVKAMTVGK